MIKDPESETGERVGRHADIVGKDIFDRVQLRLMKNAGTRKNAGNKSKEPTILARIVRCYKCESTYQCTRQGDKRYIYLRMEKNGKQSDCFCVGKSFNSRHVEYDLDTLLQRFSLTEDWQASMVESLGQDPDAEAVEKERKRIQEMMRRNAELYADLQINRDTYKTQRDQLKVTSLRCKSLRGTKSLMRASTFQKISALSGAMRPTRKRTRYSTESSMR